MFSFQAFWYSIFKSNDEIEFDLKMSKLRADNVVREEINREYYKFFAGRQSSVVTKTAADWFDKVSTQSGFYHDRICDILIKHKENGVEPVFISGSFPALLFPLAEKFGVKNILSTTMETKDGKFTGRIFPPQTIGKGKREAIEIFLKEANVNGEKCFGYGDDRSDVHMLLAVGSPTVVRGDAELERIGSERGWPLLDPYYKS